jgi:protein-tyrosine phosphatase
LWIGNVTDVADLRSIHQAGIEALIDLGINEPVPLIPRELIYCRFPLVDGQGNSPTLLQLALETTAQLIGAGTSTLVFCSAGMSRSPAVASAALSVAAKRSPEECLAEVFAGAPADLSPGLWSDLMAVTAKLKPRSGDGI